MLSTKNKSITIKVSNDAYSFITTLSKKFGVSISSFCQDCVTKAILEHDKIAHSSDKYSSPEVYWKQLAYFINESYDSRRK